MILLTGANGPLGKCLAKRLSSRGLQIVELSSSPKAGQIRYSFGDLSGLEKLQLSGSTLIHCARPSEFTERQFFAETRDLSVLLNWGVKLVNISSVSGYLVERNKYGTYKRAIEDWLNQKEQQNLVAGLLFAPDYHGQISRIRSALKFLPVCPNLVGSGGVHITPVDWLEEEIVGALNSTVQEKGPTFLTTYSKSFNWVLRQMSNSLKPEVKIPISSIEAFVRIFPRNRYFSVDSLKGITGSFEGLGERQDSIKRESELLALWDKFRTNS